MQGARKTNAGNSQGPRVKVRMAQECGEKSKIGSEQSVGLLEVTETWKQN